MNFTDDVYNNINLKAGLEEERDFYLLNEECYSYLFGIYGGTDIRRFSIELVLDSYQDD